MMSLRSVVLWNECIFDGIFKVRAPELYGFCLRSPDSSDSGQSGIRRAIVAEDNNRWKKNVSEIPFARQQHVIRTIPAASTLNE